MVLGWRKRKNNSRDHGGKPQLEIVIPTHFRCPISLDFMKDPVTLTTGITYDRESIERWFEDGNYTCPVTNQIVKSFDRIPNHTLRIMIQDWSVQNQQYGVERIPTPRIPVSPLEVTEVLERVKASARRTHQHRCLELVREIERKAAESERNKRCIVENGAAAALAAAFHAFAVDSVERNENVLEEILSALNWMFPLDMEAVKQLQSDASLRCMVRFLKHHDVSMKQKSIVALREVLSNGDREQYYMETLQEIDGVNEILAEFIRKRICPTITKASLDVVYYMVSSASPSNENTKLEFINLDLVSSLLDILIDTEKSPCERALGVFDSLCSCKEGRQKANANALTIPVLVKKILRVSELATEFSVSAIWKLVKNGGTASGSIIVDAIQFGAFQKLLLILQVDCGCEKREKITELLKLLIPYRAELDCIDSGDFKIKRSF